MADENGPGPGPGAGGIWAAAYDDLLRRCVVLEEIADRLAATSADPIAVSDYWLWKMGG